MQRVILYYVKGCSWFCIIVQTRKDHNHQWISSGPSSGTLLSRVEHFTQHFFAFLQILASLWGFAEPKHNHLIGRACWGQLGIKNCLRGWGRGKKVQRLRDFVNVKGPWLLLDHHWAGHLQPYHNKLICCRAFVHSWGILCFNLNKLHWLYIEDICHSACVFQCSLFIYPFCVWNV